ncbi:hypothetical protein SDRG_03955 [Saprolegnia diclina VS20]|uniref:Uncharacterized protein n=1 Tax=Saprolegnia diclina (strain VS20) TaxID=1156394 RepID=T0S8P6_SAPDV|nr:hypothetical protein SDRG_03955 [Saprolegnia diclina VS20]EQC39002.1 hypothetical protein SDRG_03955 [Saprolegnia diclina VS20]|eukprot:XP_008607826.1 hypothetical protein SDRG_03955 [Saprolegnia diclina VS20]
MKWKRDVEKLLEASAAVPSNPPTTPQRISGRFMATPSPRRIGGRFMESPSARGLSPLPTRSPILIDHIPLPSPASSPVQKKKKAGAQKACPLIASGRFYRTG